jgi:hypothetical protein
MHKREHKIIDFVKVELSCPKCTFQEECFNGDEIIYTTAWQKAGKPTHEQYNMLGEQDWKAIRSDEHIVGYEVISFDKSFPFPCKGGVSIFVESPHRKEGGFCICILNTSPIFQTVTDYIAEYHVPQINQKRGQNT